jgi:hypothetical protein
MLIRNGSAEINRRPESSNKAEARAQTIAFEPLSRQRFFRTRWKKSFATLTNNRALAAAGATGFLR